MPRRPVLEEIPETAQPRRPQRGKAAASVTASMSTNAAQAPTHHHTHKRLESCVPSRVDTDATPPMPPTPESPAKPAWWSEEDDERAAELLYTLFGGTVGERLENQIEEWVVRDNAVAAEAFPHVDCWIGLEIRWLRFSSAHREVADALRRLKDAFSKGNGKLRFLSIDGGRGASKDGDKKPSRARRNNRSRSATSGGGEGEEASGGELHQHPLRALSAKR